MLYTKDTLWKVARRAVCIATVAAVATSLTACGEIAPVPSSVNKAAAVPSQGSDMAEIVITASRNPDSKG